MIKGGKKADKIYGNENKNILEGGKGNDTYYINSDSENEIRVTKGDDKIIVSALSKGTVISDTEGNDTFQINGINAKDIRFVVDYANDDLFLTDSKGVKGLRGKLLFSGGIVKSPSPLESGWTEGSFIKPTIIYPLSNF